MGSLTPAATTLSSVVPGLNTVLPLVNTVTQLAGLGTVEDRQKADELRAEQNLALRQLQQKQAQDLARQEADAALDREKIAADAARAEDERLASLRRAVARQRAQFSAQGIATGAGGSSDAVLLGLFEESEEERAKREEIDTLRNRALEQDLSNRRNLNILQQTQLAEKQRLERTLSGF